jgi:hypothetical protein
VLPRFLLLLGIDIADDLTTLVDGKIGVDDALVMFHGDNPIHKCYLFYLHI